MPNSHPFLSILFPAHNEELRLPDALLQADDFIKKQSYPCELIIIENASVDATLSIAQTFARERDYVRVIHDDLPGKGRAVQKGMLLAKGTYRFICDVDLSMPIGEIAHFLPPERDGFDIAIASREARGAVRYDEPFYRHVVGRVFNSLVRILILPELNDTQCGFKCFTAEAAETLFPKMTIYGWTFDVEILAIARQMKFRTIEVPIPWYYQPHSKIHVLRDSVHMALDLLLIRRNLRRGVYSR
jgi:glycosyltransferase involved in cell wall biosynthesis